MNPSLGDNSLGRISGPIRPCKIAPSFTERTLAQYVKDHKLRGIRYFVSIPHCRVDNPSDSGTGFFGRVIEDEIGLLIHLFFCDILDS